MGILWIRVKDGQIGADSVFRIDIRQYFLKVSFAVRLPQSPMCGVCLCVFKSRKLLFFKK
jgi:hypothetical protein